MVPVRTGMTKVGLPGAKEGWQASDKADWGVRGKPGVERSAPPTRWEWKRHLQLIESFWAICEW